MESAGNMKKADITLRRDVEGQKGLTITLEDYPLDPLLKNGEGISTGLDFEGPTA